MEAEAARRVVIAVRLRELTTLPGWEVYLSELGAAEGRLIDRLISGTRDEYDYTKGMIDGIRLAGSLPQQLMSQANST